MTDFLKINYSFLKVISLFSHKHNYVRIVKNVAEYLVLFLKILNFYRIFSKIIEK